MDVLNTYGGGTDSGAVAAIVFFGVIALLFVGGAIITREYGLLLVTVVCALLVLAAVNSVHTPVRHEVTLRPGSVIDAQKYEIVEQRGAIFVIEEREVAE
jgi:hypothetical protein